jgi:hypothetical protein
LYSQDRYPTATLGSLNYFRSRYKQQKVTSSSKVRYFLLNSSGITAQAQLHIRNIRLNNVRVRDDWKNTLSNEIDGIWKDFREE